MPSADGLGWPAGKPLAISLSVMLEGWAEGSAPGIGPMGNPLKPGVADLQALSWAEYGPKVGALRLLDLLERERRTGGVLHQRRGGRTLSRRCRRRSMRVATSWRHTAGARARCPPYLTEDAERDDIARCVEVLTAHRRTRIRAAGSVRAARRVRNLAASGARRVPLARRHVRCRSAVSHRYAGRIADRHAIHHGGERHAALCPLRQRTRSVHPHAGAHRRGLAGAGQPARMPRHHRARARLRPAVWCDRFARLTGAGAPARPLLADRSREVAE